MAKQYGMPKDEKKPTFDPVTPAKMLGLDTSSTSSAKTESKASGGGTPQITAWGYDYRGIPTPAKLAGNTGKGIAPTVTDSGYDYRGIPTAEKQKEIKKKQEDTEKQKTYTYGGGSTSGGSSAPKYDTTVPDLFAETGDTSTAGATSPGYDPDLAAKYQDAMTTLERMKGETPTYGSQYDAKIKEMYEQITGRAPFRYDSATDPLYQQYVQDYTQQGKMAMRDTMGQAAALTGGYGSSYAQAVGQQQYDQYLQRMADILPQTYGMALDAYNAEGDRLAKNLAITNELEQSDYGRYLDKLNQYNTDLNRARADEEAAYGRMTDAEQRAYDRAVEADKTAYSRKLDQYDMQQDYFNRIVSLMSIGYTPSKEDYARAGLSEAQGEAIRAQYAPAADGGSTYELNPVAYRNLLNAANEEAAEATPELTDAELKAGYDALWDDKYKAYTKQEVADRRQEAAMRQNKGR